MYMRYAGPSCFWISITVQSCQRSDASAFPQQQINLEIMGVGFWAGSRELQPLPYITNTFLYLQLYEIHPVLHLKCPTVA